MHHRSRPTSLFGLLLLAPWLAAWAVTTAALAPVADASRAVQLTTSAPPTRTATASALASALPASSFDRSLRRPWIVTDAADMLDTLDLANDPVVNIPAPPVDSVRQSWTNGVTAWMNIEL